MSLEVDEDDFGGGADAHWGAPGSGAAGGVNGEGAEAIQAVGELIEDSGGEPSEGKNLASVRVSRELKRDPGLLHEREILRGVGQQDARGARLDGCAAQGGTQALAIYKRVVGDTDQLQAVNYDLFVQ